MEADRVGGRTGSAAMVTMTRKGKTDLALVGAALAAVLFALVAGGSAMPVAALLACRAGDCTMSDRGDGGRALPVSTDRLPDAGGVAAECRPDHPCAVVLTLRAGRATPEATRLRWLPESPVAAVAAVAADCCLS